MRLIAARNLNDFAAANPDAASGVRVMVKLLREAAWTSMNDVVTSVGGAKALNGDRVRFPIGGGRFRLIVAIDFRHQVVFVKFIGTHQAYDRIDALTVSQF